VCSDTIVLMIYSGGMCAGHVKVGHGSIIGHGGLCGGHVGQVTFYLMITSLITSLITGGGMGQDTSSKVQTFSGFSGGHEGLGMASSSLPPSRVSAVTCIHFNMSGGMVLTKSDPEVLKSFIEKGCATDDTTFSTTLMLASFSKWKVPLLINLSMISVSCMRSCLANV